MRILLIALGLLLMSGCTAMLLGDSNAGAYPSAKDACSKDDGTDCKSD